MARIRDVLVDKIVFVNNIVDLFTKTLPAQSFEQHLEGMGLKALHICFKVSGRLLEYVPVNKCDTLYSLTIITNMRNFFKINFCMH